MMPMKNRFTSFLVIIFLLTMSIPTSQNFLSKSGNDLTLSANQVSRVHNVDTGYGYETIQEAINAPQTQNGHKIFVDTGIYYDNVVVNKSVFLIGENRNSTVIDGLGVGTVASVTADNVTITNFTIRNSSISVGYDSIKLSSVKGCNISKNTLLDNDRSSIMLSYATNSFVVENEVANSNESGIILYNSNNNTVKENVVKYSEKHGIAVQNSSYCQIVGNIIINSTDDGIAILNSHDNRILRNIVTQGEANGIRLDDPSDNNIIAENNVTNNKEYGFWMWFSNNNKFYHNLCNNTKNVYVYPVVDASAKYKSTNIWDDGYPSGGNYWSDCNGTDLYRGPAQNEAGSDGIGDTPYVIDTDNRDRYPLMTPWASSENEQTEPSGLTINPIIVYALAGTIIAIATVVSFFFMHKRKISKPMKTKQQLQT